MLRLALIGCGFAAEAYARCQQRLRGARFVAVAEPDRAKAEEIARRMDVEMVAGGLDELLGRHPGSFGAVVIHAPSSFVAPLGLQAAAARKHVLAGPPLASSLEETERVLSAARSAGVRVMSAAVERFLPSVATLKGALASGKLGEPGLLRIHRWSPRPLPGLAEENTAWRLALREIDLARWMYGQLPSEIAAVGRGDADSSGLDAAGCEFVQIHLGFPKGGSALIDTSAALPQGTGYASRSIIGSSGAAYADDHHNMQLLFRGGAPSAVPTTEGDVATIAMLEEFAASIAGNREPSVTPSESRDTILIAEAAASCLANGRASRLVGGRYEPV